MVTAETTNRFRAVFAFGPVDEVANYGQDYLPFDTNDQHESAIRAPIRWLDSIKTPTFVFEGREQGNTQSLYAMQRASRNPLIQFHAIANGDHFTIIAPLSKMIGKKIMKDSGAELKMAFSEAELDGLVK